MDLLWLYEQWASNFSKLGQFHLKCKRKGKKIHFETPPPIEFKYHNPFPHRIWIYTRYYIIVIFFPPYPLNFSIFYPGQIPTPTEFFYVYNVPTRRLTFCKLKYHTLFFIVLSPRTTAFTCNVWVCTCMCVCWGEGGLELAHYLYIPFDNLNLMLLPVQLITSYIETNTSY